MPLSLTKIAPADTFEIPPELAETLTPHQRHYLAFRPRFTTNSDCARHIGLQPKTVYAWLRREPAFRSIHQALLASVRNLSRNLASAESDSTLPIAAIEVGKLIRAEWDDLDGAKVKAKEKLINALLKGRGVYQERREVDSVVRFELPPCLTPAGPAVIEGQFTELEETD